MTSLLRKLLISPPYFILLLAFSLLLYLLSYMPGCLSGRYYHYMSRLWCRILIRVLDVDLRLVYKGDMPVPEHYIMVANHPSALEDFAVPALFDIYPLAKIEVRHWYVLGRISDYAGTIYVERDNIDSRKMALKHIVDAVLSGKNLVIFPEGGCKGKRIHDHFKSGAFDASLQSGVPILPVYLHYHDEDTYEWTHESLLQKCWQIFLNRDNRVDYEVHDALFPDDLPADITDKRQFAEYTRQLFLEWERERLGSS